MDRNTQLFQFFKNQEWKLQKITRLQEKKVTRFSKEYMQGPFLSPSLRVFLNLLNSLYKYECYF